MSDKENKPVIATKVPFDTGPIHFVGIGGVGMSGIVVVGAVLQGATQDWQGYGKSCRVVAQFLPYCPTLLVCKGTPRRRVMRRSTLAKASASGVRTGLRGGSKAIQKSNLTNSMRTTWSRVSDLAN